jgi:hypothetical protein
VQRRRRVVEDERQRHGRRASLDIRVGSSLVDDRLEVASTKSDCGGNRRAAEPPSDGVKNADAVRR